MLSVFSGGLRNLTEFRRVVDVSMKERNFIAVCHET
jgi:hypothetical protein